jgi:superfamily II DNA or RNA helicase
MSPPEITATINNVNTYLSDYTAELEAMLAIQVPGYFFAPSYKRGVWDGKFRFLRQAKNPVIPTGLLFIVKEYCEQSGITLNIIDNRTCQIKADLERAMSLFESRLFLLREYQAEAIDCALTKHQGIIEMPTGSGKTEVAIATINAILTQSKDLRCLFLVHTSDLMYQTVQRFKDRTPKLSVGLLGDGQKKDGQCIVAMVQTLLSRAKADIKAERQWLLEFGMLIVDECHHSSADSFYTVGMDMKNAFYRFGLSGTAMKRDVLSNMKMMAMLGPPIYKLRSRELIDSGDLCPIGIVMIKNDECIKHGTFAEIYKAAITESISRNSKITEIAKQEFLAGRRILILVRHIEHGNILSRMLTMADCPNTFISGSDSSEQRASVKTAFEQEKFILIASTIYSEGVDIPAINTLIVASAGLSDVQTIQRVGRGLRQKKDGSALSVYDFMDSSKFLAKHSAARRKTYIEEEFINE